MHAFMGNSVQREYEYKKIMHINGIFKFELHGFKKSLVC